MRRIVFSCYVAIFLLATSGLSGAVTIDSVDFEGWIPSLGKTPISVTATDPAGGNLSYFWEVVNGPASSIVGSGPEVLFDPSDSGPHPCPYKIKVEVTSDISGLTAHETISIGMYPAGDANHDHTVNARDTRVVRDHLGETGDPGWIGADLNYDGRVNARDLRPIRDTLGQRSLCSDLYFFDNFEGGLGKWDVSGNDWDLTPSEFQGGQWSFTDSPDGDYLNNANSTATIRYPIDLSSSTHPVLTFWHRAFLAYTDYIYVEVSTDGFNWSEVYSTGNNYSASTYSQTVIDLSAYREANVLIRFRLRETNAYEADGWYIDNVEVRELADEPEMPFPFIDDFESGTDDWLLSGLDWETIPEATLGGSYAITESAGGNYPNNANSTLTVKGHFDLSASTHPVLSFWHKTFLAYTDYIYVEISTDGGFNWTTIYSTGNNYSASTYSQTIIDLSTYREPNVKIRFRLRETNAYESDGWYIDYVEVRELADAPILAFPFFDDFESGTSNWILSGTDWELTDAEAVSGTYCITDSRDGDYPDNSNATLQLKCIDLTTASMPVLRFWHKYFLAYTDYIYVEVSVDGGFTWDTPLLYTGNNVSQSTFTPMQLDLSPYNGNVACIRFRLRETNAYASDGWHIDDVEIRELFPE